MNCTRQTKSSFPVDKHSLMFGTGFGWISKGMSSQSFSLHISQAWSIGILINSMYRCTKLGWRKGLFGRCKHWISQSSLPVKKQSLKQSSRECVFKVNSFLWRPLNRSLRNHHFLSIDTGATCMQSCINIDSSLRCCHARTKFCRNTAAWAPSLRTRLSNSSAMWYRRAPICLSLSIGQKGFTWFQCNWPAR